LRSASSGCPSAKIEFSRTVSDNFRFDFEVKFRGLILVL